MSESGVYRFPIKLVLECFYRVAFENDGIGGKADFLNAIFGRPIKPLTNKIDQVPKKSSSYCNPKKNSLN